MVRMRVTCVLTVARGGVKPPTFRFQAPIALDSSRSCPRGQRVQGGGSVRASVVVPARLLSPPLSTSTGARAPAWEASRFMGHLLRCAVRECPSVPTCDRSLGTDWARAGAASLGSSFVWQTHGLAGVPRSPHRPRGAPALGSWRGTPRPGEGTSRDSAGWSARSTPDVGWRMRRQRLTCS